VRWRLRGDSPVRVDGEGVIESFVWQTKRRAFHASAQLHESQYAQGLDPRLLSGRQLRCLIRRKCNSEGCSLRPPLKARRCRFSNRHIRNFPSLRTECRFSFVAESGLTSSSSLIGIVTRADLNGWALENDSSPSLAQLGCPDSSARNWRQVQMELLAS
jgi:hypothetical protein